MGFLQKTHTLNPPMSSELVGLDHFPSPRWRPQGSTRPRAWCLCCSDTPRWWHCHKSTPWLFPMIRLGGWVEMMSNGKHTQVNKRFMTYHKKSARHTNQIKILDSTHTWKKTYLGLKQIQDHWRVRWSNTCSCKSTDKKNGWTLEVQHLYDTGCTKNGNIFYALFIYSEAGHSVYQN